MKVSAVWVLLFSCGFVFPVPAAVMSFSPNPPLIGPFDISNLVGASRDMDNVGTASADGNANDGTTYVAFDRPAQGQTFRTGTAYPLYQIMAVTIRHVGYLGSNPGGQSVDNTWYYMPAGGRFTIRITRPDSAGSDGFVLGSETYVLTGTEANLFASSAVANTPDGTGTWITFVLDTPIVLSADTLYGFDISSNQSAFFESWGIKDSAAGGNPYPQGTAYTSGSAGTPNNILQTAPGDRVFVIHLTGRIPENGDLTGNGKVDLEDIAVLAAGWQNLYDLSALAQIVSNWLVIEPPVFRSNPLRKPDAPINSPYSGTLTEDVVYYDVSLLAFSKIDGPLWLTVAADGTLSGIPAFADMGLNSFTVQVQDGVNPPVQTVLQIMVAEPEGPVELLKPVPFTHVALADEFWLPRLQTNQQVTIPYVFSQLEQTGRIDNFAIAGGLMTGSPRYNFPFDDTDVYKTLEGAAYSLQVQPNPVLDQYLDNLIVKIAAAQANNGFFPGYLYTIRTNGVDIWCGPTPWSNLRMSHELYDAGHLIEAAMAHYQATGKTSLLNVATAFADLLVNTFYDGGVEIPPGHEIVESALARLYDVTGNINYLNLARYYLDIRGTVTDDYSPWGEYHQDHLPVLQQTEAVGHVVRALYLYMGMADVAARTNDAAYRRALMTALDSIWHSVNDAKAYITGGLGAMHGGESFGAPYELPHDGYCETCAQIANVMWNQRMFLYYRDGKYIDVLERTLYNALISGVSLKGDTFFYPNPLISSGGYTRSSWFACNCCIGNIARTIPSIPGYVYARTSHDIYVNLYAAGTGRVPLEDGEVILTQEGNYPWDGHMTIRVDPNNPASFTIYLRIPGWARNQPVPGDLYTYTEPSGESAAIDVNGTPVPLNIQKGYAVLNRTWQPGDQIHLYLPMPVRRVQAHPNVAACTDQVSLERGPIVYCVEWPDFAAQNVFHLYIPSSAVLESEYRDNILGDPTIVNKGCVLRGTVRGVYEASGGGTTEQDEPFTAIPYYAWAHRGAGQMTVWLPTDSSRVTPLPLPTSSEMLGYWTLDETSGTTAADSSGKGMNGTLMNGLSFSTNSVTGRVGRALNFDGTNDYIDLPDGFNDFVKGCTISLWVYPTAVRNWARFIDFGNGAASDNIWFGRQGTTANLAFECWSGGTSNGLVVAENAISLNEWQMFTVTVDRFGNVRLFKNGQLIQTGTSRPTSVVRTQNYIGRSNWSADAYYRGRMDDIRIYNYNLSDAEVLALYNTP
ncbi:MAG TPA: glycoside hydrolase family 127 protein [Anaerohalosphaeraceae bacterium]|nr:glycoside hydrolase family 127 protein [Anaerohalosphaeraceae bacterium]HOL89883.1 glycoside hydrolase family 127 protein [Anaerohalosphaeraceae bacterium]HPP56808.1 glycoside hydrolase family 127 protein [Anaerohalosphaeraceae bacterium]